MDTRPVRRGLWRSRILVSGSSRTGEWSGGWGAALHACAVTPTSLTREVAHQLCWEQQRPVCFCPRSHCAGGGRRCTDFPR